MSASSRKLTDEQVRARYREMRIRAEAVVGNATEPEAARDAARWILEERDEDDAR